MMNITVSQRIYTFDFFKCFCYVFSDLWVIISSFLMWIIVRMNELLQKNRIVNALLLGHFR